ncbi:18830_t:CDS:2 [Dentiscutata erythropus]|uniref:18830_t:CDS:1 n=1 Tax=Dentiscutata erythropus TaxID=1348616 RepID=A0A9N9DTM7_9GLOM|nr:18830_t:CDS:2 [Dentiscutata erythropus]
MNSKIGLKKKFENIKVKDQKYKKYTITISDANAICALQPLVLRKEPKKLEPIIDPIIELLTTGRKSIRRLSKTGSSSITTSKPEKEPTSSQPTTASNKDHQTSQPPTSLATH